MLDRTQTKMTGSSKRRSCFFICCRWFYFADLGKQKATDLGKKHKVQADLLRVKWNLRGAQGLPGEGGWWDGSEYWLHLWRTRVHCPAPTWQLTTILGVRGYKRCPLLTSVGTEKPKFICEVLAAKKWQWGWWLPDFVVQWKLYN